MSTSSVLAEILHREHVNTATALSALEERIFGRDKGKPIVATAGEGRAELQTLLDVIDHDVKRHFRFEEDRLFPALDSRGYTELTRMLKQEHDAIRTFAAALEAVAGRAMADGFDRESWQAFREAGMDLIPSVMFHIQKEETSVIKCLTFLLKAEEDRAFAEEYRLASAGEH